MNVKDLFDKLVYKYNGQYCFVLPDSIKYNHAQCFDVPVAFTDMLGVPHYPGNPSPFPYADAHQIYNNFGTFQAKYFERIAETPDFIPQKGDIIVWSSTYNGGPGHVGIVESATIDKVRVFDQNNPVGSKCKISEYSYNKILGYLRYKSSTVTPQPPVTVDTTLKLREALNAKIQDIGVRGAYLADFTLLVDDVIKYKGEVDDKNIIIRQKDEWINSQGKTIIEYVDDVGRLRKELVDKEKAFAKSMDHTVSTHVNELLVQEGKYKELSDQLKVCQSQKPKNWIVELIDIVRDTFKKRREQ